MKSLQQKLNELTQIAFNIAYANTRKGHYHNTRDIDLGDWDDIVWMLVDGLYHKWFFDRMEGRCSLRAIIDFDIADEEKKIDKWIEELSDFYSKLEPIYEIEA